jgi:3-deoxy-manno-octulosonate cytidylyltransferase (CMP-KDO synthetase)
MSAVIIIPSRLASTRLPNKPLADIMGKPMIIRVAEQATKANIGEVIIACGDQEILGVVKEHGFNGVLTDPKLQSGSDRVYEAYEKLNLNAEVILNVQGDLPIISPKVIKQIYNQLIDSKTDIATAAAKIVDEEEKVNPNVVKAVIAKNNHALYFTRSKCPYGEGDLYHHIGIYAYTNAALKSFVALEQSPLERRESLEQLRALENGMTISVAIVDEVPIGVDTPADLEKARRFLAQST